MTATTSDLLELETGKLAAGGACVARHPDGRVVFVRHALPGERVVARVTEEAARFVRADAIEILEASPSRVAPPCPAAGPGRCGGCDFQHVDLAEQRRLKAGLVEEQLARLAGCAEAVTLETLPGAPDGLGWRTRVRFAVDADGGLGLRRHRSHEVERLAACPIAAPGVEAVGAEQGRWPGAEHVEVHAPSGAAPTRALVVVDTGRPTAGRELPRPPEGVGMVVRGKTVRTPDHLEVVAGGHRFQVSARSFWQVHVAAPDVLTRAVLDALDPRPGDRVADLYGGVGLFSAALAAAVGETGRVVAVERSRRAVADATANLRRFPWVEVRPRPVTPATLGELGPLDLVVLDPPREGGGRALMAALAALEPAPRAVAYVACDAASFARDLAELRAAGWTLRRLRGFDLFPMTEHVELVAHLEPPARSAPSAGHGGQGERGGGGATG